MATARLWWNGSSWVTTNTYWKNESKNGSYQLGATHLLQIAAYDDMTIKMSQGHSGYQTASIYVSVVVDSDSITVKSGSTTIGTGVFSNANVTSYTSFSYSGSIGVLGYENWTSHYSGALSFSGSTTITSPFRTITYNANGGSGAPASTKVLTGISGTLSSTRPTKTGYTFLGWSTSQTATTATYTAGGSIVTSSNTTLYAVWQANDQTITITKPATATITVTKGGAAVGNTVKYDDVITITATASAGYRILSLQVNGSDFTSGNTYTVKGDVSIVATTIAQSSTIATYDSTVSTLDTFNLTVNRYSESHYNKLRYYDSNDTLLYTSEVFTEATSLVVPQAWFTDFGTDTSITITAILTTYTEPECINVTGVTETCSFTVTADASMKPTLAAGVITLTPYNTGTGAANLSNPGYVKGYSKVQAAFDTSKITHAVGASAGTYAISAQGTATSGSSTTLLSSNILTAAGQITVTYTVTDSRGRSTTDTATITVNDYANPAIASLNCYRCDIDGTEDEDENYMAVTAGCTFTTLSDNAITITVEVKPVNGTYTSYGTILNAIKSVIGGAFLPDTSYFVKVTVTDTVGNSAYTEMSMPRRSWIFHMRQSLGGPGAAFGKVTETDYALQLADGWKFMMGNTQMTETDLSNILSGGGSGGAKIHVGPNAPTDPDENIWLDTDEPSIEVGSLPSGGNKNDVLVKGSSTDYDSYWSPLDMIADICSINGLWSGAGGSVATLSLYNCTGTISQSPFYKIKGLNMVIAGRIRINSISRTGSNCGVEITIPNGLKIDGDFNTNIAPSSYSDAPRNGESTILVGADGATKFKAIVSETFANVANGKTLLMWIPVTVIRLKE